MKKTSSAPKANPNDLLAAAIAAAATASAAFCNGGVCAGCGGKGCGACLKRYELRNIRAAEARVFNAERKAALVATQKECQICERNQCVSRKGLMVLHGYERPGFGFIQGSCFGVGYVDYGTGTDALEIYAGRLVEMLKDAEEDLQRYVRGEVTHFETVRGEQMKDEKGWGLYDGRKPRMQNVWTSWAPGVSDGEKYAGHLRSKQSAASGKVNQIEGELVRVKARIAAWKPAKKTGKK